MCLRKYNLITAKPAFMVCSGKFSVLLILQGHRKFEQRIKTGVD